MIVNHRLPLIRVAALVGCLVVLVILFGYQQKTPIEPSTIPEVVVRPPADPLLVIERDHERELIFISPRLTEPVSIHRPAKISCPTHRVGLKLNLALGKTGFFGELYLEPGDRLELPSTGCSELIFYGPPGTDGRRAIVRRQKIEVRPASTRPVRPIPGSSFTGDFFYNKNSLFQGVFRVQSSLSRPGGCAVVIAFHLCRWFFVAITPPQPVHCCPVFLCHARLLVGATHRHHERRAGPIPVDRKALFSRFLLLADRRPDAVTAK